MSVAAVRRVVSRLEPGDPPTDAELVAAIAPSGAGREAAFAELVRRYGPMVLGVCRRVLADAHTAEDAFQAAFLVLARKAGTIRPPGAVGGWLHGVAVRTARKAKTAAARRRRREMAAIASAKPAREVGGELQRAELRAIIDAELAALPETHRAAVVLCDLHGKTRAEAAAELDRAEGTVAAWLARGRKALAARLARRGVTLPAAGLVAALSPAVVSADLASAARATFLGRGVPDAVLTLAEGVMRSFSSSASRLAAVAVAVGAVLAAVATAAAWQHDPQPNPMAETQPVAAPADEPKPEPTMLGDHKGYVYSVSYSPGGKKFLSVGNGTAIVWDSDSRKKLFTFDAEFAAFSGDGKSLFALAKDEFRHIDAETGKTLAKKDRDQPKRLRGGQVAAFSPNGKMHVEFDGISHHLRGDFKGDLPNLADQYDSGDITSEAEVVYGPGAAFNPDGTLFAGTHRNLKDGKGGQGVLSIWDPGTGKRIGTISRDINHPIYAFAWSPDGKEIAVGFGDGVRVYDAKTLKESRVLDPPGKWGDPLPWTTALAWSMDGKTLAAAVTTEVRKPEITDDDRVLVKVSAIKVAVRLLDATTGKELRRFEGFPDNLPVVSLALRGDGKQLVCGSGFFPGDGPASNYPQPAKDAPALRVIPLADPPAKAEPGPWKESKALELTGWLGGSVAYSADAKTLFVGGTSGHVRAYDAATMKQLWEYKDGEHFAAVALAPDGKTLAITTKDGVRFLEAATGKATDVLEEKDSAPQAVAFFPEKNVGQREGEAIQRQVIFGNARGYSVKSWILRPIVSTVKTETVAPGKKPADEHAVPIAVSPDGKRVVVTGPIDKDTGKNVLWAWGAGSGEANKLLEGHKAAVVSAAWSKDGKLIVTGDAGGVAIAWDAETFKEKSRLRVHGRVAAVAISPDGKTAAAAVVSQLEGLPGKEVYSEEVFVWDAANPPAQPKAVSRNPAGGPFAGVAAVAFAPDGKSLASCFANFTHLARGGRLVGTVRVFALEPEKPRPEAKPDGKFVTGVGFSPDGKRYFVLKGGKADVFDAVTGQEVWSALAEEARFTADGKWLVAMTPKEVAFHEIEKGPITNSHARPKTKLEWHRVAFAPDGKKFVAHFGDEARVYDTATGVESVRLDDHVERPGWFQGPTGLAVSFSPDGKKVVKVGAAVAQGGQRGAAVWDAQTGTLLRAIDVDLKDVLRAAAFSPDGSELAVAFKDRVEVWTVGGVAKKNPVRTFRTAGRATALAYSKDGKLLAVGVRKPVLGNLGGNPKDQATYLLGHEGQVQVFDAATAEEVKRVRGFAGGLETLPVTALAFSPDGKKVLAGTGVSALEPFNRLPHPKEGEFKLFDLEPAAPPE